MSGFDFCLPFSLPIPAPQGLCQNASPLITQRELRAGLKPHRTGMIQILLTVPTPLLKSNRERPAHGLRGAEISRLVKKQYKETFTRCENLIRRTCRNACSTFRPFQHILDERRTIKSLYTKKPLTSVTTPTRSPRVLPQV